MNWQNAVKSPAKESSQPADYRWQFFLSPPEAWAAMLAACEQAAVSIEFEQYILENDAVGRRFLEVFAAKAAAGVRVFVIVDGWGSLNLLHAPLVKEIRAKGGSFYFYHKPRLFELFFPGRWFPRTHIKTMLVDGKTAFVGGVCIDERMKGWRDTQLRIEGPVAAQVSRAFDRAEKLIRKRGQESPERLKDDAEFGYLQSYPLRGWNVIYQELIEAIEGAKERILISSPFFAPNRRFKKLLHEAAQRGVVVQLIVPAHTDVGLADCLLLSYAKNLLRSGVAIFYYQDSVLHNKTVVVDKDWATVGSTNMDVLSFFRNRESNIVIRNEAAVEEMATQFAADLTKCRKLTAADIAQAPRWKFAAGYLMRGVKAFLYPG